MRVKLTHVFRLSLALVILANVAQPFVVLTGAKVNTGTPSPAAASPGTLQAGDDDTLGSFKLHVQIQQRRVAVKDQKGGAATQLVAEFAAWEPQSGVATINVAVRNVGADALSGSLEAAVVKKAPPTVVPLNADGETGTGSPNWAYNGVSLPPGATSAPREWQFKSPRAMDFQLDVELRLRPRAAIPAGAGATVTGPDGASVTIQPNSVPYDVFVDIRSVPASAVEAPLGALEFVGAVEVTFEPAAGESASLVPPSAPLTLSIPAPPGLTTSNFVVGQQLMVDSVDQETPGLSKRLVATDTASSSGGQIVTEANVFPGVFGGGMFVFVANHGSGFARGVVSDNKGPQAGVVVSNNTNTLVSITGGGGQYTLYINGGPFGVSGFDPFTGSTGAGSGNIVVSGSTVVADFTLTPNFAPPTTRDGIRNGGFERGDGDLNHPVPGWSVIGAARPTQVFSSSATTIQPKEGKWMADVSTGGGAIGGAGSGLKQKFIVPAGASTLTFDFNFISEEFPEFVGSVFDDSFRALITTDTNQITFAQVSVNQSGGFTLIGDCGFPGGDESCGQTGWREASVDLSPFSGLNAPITVELLFSSIDAGDNIYDTHVLIDNIRFSTVWIDVKRVAGSTSDLERVEQEILEANDILSQAGINLRLRNLTTIDGTNLLLPDITFTKECPQPACKYVPTADITALLGLSRSTEATDVNAYYVSFMTEKGQFSGAVGLAVGPDDYRDIALLSNSGIVITNVFPECSPGGHVIAHELGHLLISPQRDGDPLEHRAGPDNFMGGTCVGPTSGIINRQQSANINRAGAFLLGP